MMWLLLFALTALVLFLPLLPALVEWRWPSDDTPPRVDSEDTLPRVDSPDALDPPLLARSFAARLSHAVAAGQTELGHAAIAVAPPYGPWPLDAAERRTAVSRRVWHAAVDADLPAGCSFLAEVAARGHLHTAERGVYRALWAEGALHLAAQVTVLRWAHGAQVEVADNCCLTGRITADESITVRGRASYTLMHAPTLNFAAMPASAASALPAGPGLFTAGLPAPVVWDSIATRGTCNEALQIAADRAWCGDLVCRDDLTLGPGCSVHGSLKARGDIVADERCRITGSVIAEGRIELGERCSVRGSVLSDSAIVLGAGCRVGAPGYPATVAAPEIVVAPGVIIHGTLWAGVGGHVQTGALPPDPTRQWPEGSPHGPLQSAAADPLAGAANAAGAPGAAAGPNATGEAGAASLRIAA